MNTQIHQIYWKNNLKMLLYHLSFLIFFSLILFLPPAPLLIIPHIKLLVSPWQWKNLFFYIYGRYGCNGIILGHIIVIFILFFLSLYNKKNSRILFLHSTLLPIFFSIYGYLSEEKEFIQYGLIGEIGGKLFKMIPLYYYFFFFCFILYIFASIGFSHIKSIFSFIYLLLEKTMIIRTLKTFKQYLIAWLRFFIPKTKYTSFESKYNIEQAIYESIHKDFFNTCQLCNIPIIETEKTIEKNQLPYQKILSNKAHNIKIYNQEISENEKKLFFDILDFFAIKGTYVTSFVGPSINTIIFIPDLTTKLQKIHNSIDDIARAFGHPDMRILYPVEGFSYSIGFEYPHHQKEIIYFQEYAYDKYFIGNNPIEILCGLKTNGLPYYIEINKAPHILIAGTTGSGKSCILNLFIISLIWKNSFESVRLILIDPKKTEFFMYHTLPHLLFPVAYEIAVIEEYIIKINKIMEERYDLFKTKEVKNLEEYNKKYQSIPFIIIIIDEYADIIIQSKTIEIKILKLLQMSRAAGIHIIIATQRPSADIINSTLKSNLPLRIACKVSSSIDSRIILDIEGAQKLLGNGDMIILDNAKYHRVHGLFINNELIETIINSFV